MSCHLSKVDPETSGKKQVNSFGTQGPKNKCEHTDAPEWTAPSVGRLFPSCQKKKDHILSIK